MEWIILFIVIVVIWGAISSIDEKEAAKKRYLESLDKLKLNPTNADLKQETLALGRIYS